MGCRYSRTAPRTHTRGANGDIAIANGAGANAYAFGTDNYASVDGANSTAIAGATSTAGAGSSADNTAFVFGDNSYGYAGTTYAANPGSFNYSVIFGNDDAAYSGGNAAGAGSYAYGAYVEGNDLGTAHAQGGDYLADILKFYGDGGTTTTAAAADSTNLLSASDPSGALADGQAFWADLFSGGHLRCPDRRYQLLDRPPVGCRRLWRRGRQQHCMDRPDLGLRWCGDRCGCQQSLD